MQQPPRLGNTARCCSPQPCRKSPLHLRPLVCARQVNKDRLIKTREAGPAAAVPLGPSCRAVPPRQPGSPSSARPGCTDPALASAAAREGANPGSKPISNQSPVGIKDPRLHTRPGANLCTCFGAAALRVVEQQHTGASRAKGCVSLHKRVHSAGKRGKHLQHLHCLQQTVGHSL